jgi:hypothetical protein
MTLSEFIVEILKERGFIFKATDFNQNNLEKLRTENNEIFELSKKIVFELNKISQRSFSNELKSMNEEYLKIEASFYGVSGEHSYHSLSLNIPENFLKLLGFEYILNKRSLEKFSVQYKFITNKEVGLFSYYGNEYSPHNSIDTNYGSLYLKYLKKIPTFYLVDANQELALGSLTTTPLLSTYFKYIILATLSNDEHKPDEATAFNELANNTLDLLLDEGLNENEGQSNEK